MKQIVDYRINNKTHSRKTIVKRFSLKNVENLSRIEKYVKNNGNKRQKWDRIEKYVLEKYRIARNRYLPVHTIDLIRWALECASNNNFKIKASMSWAQRFKKKNRIVSRKAVKIVSQREISMEKKLEETIDEFKIQFNEVKNGFSPRYKFRCVLVARITFLFTEKSATVIKLVSIMKCIQ